MPKVLLKQTSPALSWVRVSSFVVLLVSLILASWFIANRESDTPSRKTKKEDTEKGDILPKLTRIDPIEVTLILITSFIQNYTFPNGIVIIQRQPTGVIILPHIS